MKGYYCLIIMLFTVFALTYSLPVNNQKERKSININKPPSIGLILMPDPDPDPGLLGAALGCSHIPVFGCFLGAALPI